MFDFPTTPDDDPEFIAKSSVLIRGMLRMVKPRQLFLVKVDQWFSFKWLGFSGKVLGALSVWQHKMTLPPFHPHRIRWQRHYHQSDAGDYDHDGEGITLAIRQTSSNNLRRTVSRLPFSSAALVWFSGASKQLGRGSLMAYYNTPSDRSGFHYAQNWYTGFERDGDWRIVRAKQMSRRELDALENLGRGEQSIRQQ